MKIKQISLKDFRCFDRLQVDFAPEHTVHVVIGEQHAGKSALLEALRLAASAYSWAVSGAAPDIAPADHRVSGADPVADRVQAVQLKVEATLSDASGQSREAAWVKFTNSPTDTHSRLLYAANLTNPVAVAKAVYAAAADGNRILPVLKSIGQHYSLTKSAESQRITLNGNAADGYLHCWDSAAPERYLFACLDRLPAEGFTVFQQAVLAVLPALETVTWLRDQQQLVVKFANGDVRTLDMLGDGDRYLLLLAGELATRAFLLNQHLGTSVLAQTSGLVLIDGFGHCLHPSLQSDALARLQQTFPLVQFILSTHSPLVLNGLKREQIHLLDIDDDGKRTHSHPEEDAIGLGAEGILLKLFGLTTTYDKQSIAWNEEYKILFRRKTTAGLTEAEAARFQELGGLLAGFRLDPSLQVREEDSVTRAVREQMAQREQTRTRGLDTPPVSYAELNSEVENALNSLF